VTGLFGLFMAAFLAATPIPMQSELVFLALQANGWGVASLIITASIGNTLGSCVTYFFGRGIETFKDRRWFPLPPTQMAKAKAFWARWGLWSLLLSWAPGGDLLVALAGVMRVPFWRFLALVAIAKTARYIAVAFAASAIF